MSRNRTNTAAIGHNSGASAMTDEKRANLIAEAIFASDQELGKAATVLEKARTAQLRLLAHATEGCSPITEKEWADFWRDAVNEALKAKGYSDASLRVKLANYKAVILRLTSGAKDCRPTEGETFNAYRERQELKAKKGAQNKPKAGNAKGAATIESAAPSNVPVLNVPNAINLLCAFDDDSTVEAVRDRLVLEAIFSDDAHFGALMEWAHAYYNTNVAPPKVEAPTTRRRKAA